MLLARGALDAPADGLRAPAVERGVARARARRGVPVHVHQVPALRRPRAPVRRAPRERQGRRPAALAALVRWSRGRSRSSRARPAPRAAGSSTRCSSARPTSRTARGTPRGSSSFTTCARPRPTCSRRSRGSSRSPTRPASDRDATGNATAADGAGAFLDMRERRRVLEDPARRTACC